MIDNLAQERCGLVYRAGFESNNLRKLLTKIKNKMEDMNMSLDLVVTNAMGNNLSGLQTVSDQNNNTSALQLSSNCVKIEGQDICGSALPVFLEQNTSKLTYSPDIGPNNTLGRFIRFQNNTSNGNYFYDIGIDQKGNLFINGMNSIYGGTNSPILIISQKGDVTITGNLTVQGSIIYQGAPQSTDPDKGLAINTKTNVIGID